MPTTACNLKVKLKMKQAYFDTLAEALASEGLTDSWGPAQTPLDYNETQRWAWDDGSEHGRQISVYRAETGRYERPVHYAR